MNKDDIYTAILDQDSEDLFITPDGVQSIHSFEDDVDDAINFIKSHSTEDIIKLLDKHKGAKHENNL